MKEKQLGRTTEVCIILFNSRNASYIELSLRSLLNTSPFLRNTWGRMNDKQKRKRSVIKII